MFIFQDTNPLCVRAFASALGVSKEKDFLLNIISIPRKVGEAIAAVCKLKYPDATEKMVIIEYYLHPTLLPTEPTDQLGYSRYPGVSGVGLYQLPEYTKVLDRNQGVV
jgi:hypothetical protein